MVLYFRLDLMSLLATPSRAAIPPNINPPRIIGRTALTVFNLHNKSFPLICKLSQLANKKNLSSPQVMIFFPKFFKFSVKSSQIWEDNSSPDS